MRGALSCRLSATMVVAALAALAGCGDDGGEGTAATTLATTTTTTTTGTAGSAFTGEGSEEFCQLARQNSESIDAIGTAIADPEQLETVLRQAESAVRQAEGAAPPEIRSDVELLADAYRRLLESLEAGSLDLSELSNPEIQAAADRVARFGREVCGVG